MYTLTYTRDGRVNRHVGTRAQVQALADYITATFRIVPTIRLGVQS